MATSSVLTITIDHSGQTPKYMQLQGQIEKLIEQGRLLSGEKLPSSRELVSTLSISRTSVLKALDNLIAEGVLSSQAKKGVFVASSQPPYRNSGFSHLQRGEFHTSTSRIEKRDKEEQKWAFDSGADTKVFPSKDWANSLKKAWQVPDQKMMQGAYADGFPELKRQICGYMRELRGLNCDPEQIIVTAGSRDALSILAHALLVNDGGQIWLEAACYPQIPALFRWLENPIGSLELDEQGACLPTDSKTQGQQITVLTPCRQYPLGSAMSSFRRQAWLEFLAEQKQKGQEFWLIEDDYDNEFVYQGRVSVPLMQQDKSDSIFFVGSFSKVLFRGLRLGFIVAPKTMTEKIKQSQQTLGVSGASVAQPALANFMAGGGFVKHLRKMRRHYVAKRNFCHDALLPLADFFEWQKPQGGMHLCLRLQPQFAQFEGDIGREAESLGLNLNPLSRHFITEPKQFGFVIGYSQPSLAELSAYLDIFSQSVKKVLSQK